MKVKDIFWLRDNLEYPMIFYYKRPMLEFTHTVVPDAVEVYGILRNGYNYRGVTIVFIKTIEKTMTGNTISKQWIDLKTFIKLYGEFTTKE